jgi:hypothetical protein
MARAIAGEVIIGEGQGAYTNEVLYRRRCDNCRGLLCTLLFPRCGCCRLAPLGCMAPITWRALTASSVGTAR